MILALSVRYNKHIATLLLSVFYAQFLLAGVRRESNPVLYASTSTRHSLNGIRTFLNNTSIQGSPTPMSGQPVAKTVFKLDTLFRLDTSVVNEAQGVAVRKAPVIAPEKASMGGPTQPEMQAFTSVNADNMVDMFTGDFSYNIPLLDVGGYPVNIAYRAGSSMDDEASWVGLGWSINPGSITRAMRGVPDDFNGAQDTITKTTMIQPNTTFGATTGVDVELIGLPIGLGIQEGIFHNTYRGWGMEVGLNVSLNSGAKASGPLSGGLSLSDNSQDGLTITPSLSMRFLDHTVGNNGSSFSMGANMALPYNSRTGIKGLQMGISDQETNKSHKNLSSGGDWSTELSFAGPTYTPTINMPLTNSNYSFTAKIGAEALTVHPSWFLRGYTSKEQILLQDSTLVLPVYGYMNFQNINNNWSALTDFNREKEIPYRKNPPIPHIAVPAYTYDVFTINGEGTGGMFRPYRGDVGFIADHLMSTKTNSFAASVDIGVGDDLHGGVDLNANYSTTKTGPWLNENILQSAIHFQPNNGLYEGVYFRNPGEKSINDTAFYNALGGDDVVNPVLLQPGGSSDPSITASNTLVRSSGGKVTGTVNLTPTSAVRTARDKRTEVISYLNAAQASVVGLDKKIYHYGINQFGLLNCTNDSVSNVSSSGTGFVGYYYVGRNFDSLAHIRYDSSIYFNWSGANPFWINHPLATNGMVNYQDQTFPSTNFSVRWLGTLQAPWTGTYTFGVLCDDGIRMWMDDSLILDRWAPGKFNWDSTHVNLQAGQQYNIKVEYFQGPPKGSVAYVAWRPPGSIVPIDANSNKSWIPARYVSPPGPDTSTFNSFITQEDRVNTFRKPNHISEIDVLNADGRRYVYGIPVYNINQQEVSFNSNPLSGTLSTGMTGYTQQDVSTNNREGKDWYYSRESVPAYAHSFLLTGILSSDYVDVTGDGISDDDIGEAVKFNYSKTAGIANPYGWRAPYIKDSANYNEGFRSYTRDDKGHYIYGTKELWYLNSIESKTMIATFTLQHRSDLLGVDERGNKTDSTKGMCLKQIDLYSKADFLAHGTNATPIKTVHFVYDYELCRGINMPTNDSGKLTLKEIWFSYNGNNKGVLNPYVFNYHPNNPNYKINSTDKWGTYKDASMNPGANATKIITNAEYPYALQDSVRAAYNAGAWSLDSINLPSGGSIKVNYESDDYAFVQNRRATQMFKLAGFGATATSSVKPQLYVGGLDNFYAFIKVDSTPTSLKDLYTRYLTGLSKIYFKLYLQMPADMYGSGYDYVPCYADLDTANANWYGIAGTNMIWVKLAGVNKAGNSTGTYSPLTETAINYLRLNLPEKAYPGSEIGDNLDVITAVKMVQSMAGNILEAIDGFDNTARGNGWVNQMDTSRSYVRLDCPSLRKLGGGYRVKSILIYDNWKTMGGGRQTVYGQTYDYRTTQVINGDSVQVSSGVAQWEPSVGAEENPFHLPIEYLDRASMLAPAAAQYTEEPLGETFFPGPSVGYSKVKVTSIHNGPQYRSSNGYTINTFYTSYDFPTIWDWSTLDNNSEKSFNPVLSNLLRIDARNYLTMSQGFKVELNDMNGKPHTVEVYPQTDSLNPISYTENFYQVDNQQVQTKHLNNVVTTIDPYGNIDTAATIGKDLELMTDMREQTTTVIGANINVNTDMFQIGIIPAVIPSLLNLYQHEEDQFRSVAMTKIIHRYGILDSVLHIDKGSKVTTHNLLYDAETGDPVLNNTQNEFNDPVYTFTYPSHWMYDGVGPAYQNIGAVLNNLTIQHGVITAGLGQPASTYLETGDECYVLSKQTLVPGCTPAHSLVATFPNALKLWVVDTAIMSGGTPAITLMDQYGTPFTGNDVNIMVIRSGHRNIAGSTGSITSLNNPLVKNGSGNYQLVFDSTKAVIQASANQLQQVWQVQDSRREDIQTACVSSSMDSLNAANGGCNCLQPLFNYLISSRKLLTSRSQNLTVRQMVDSANAAGAGIDTNACAIINTNLNGQFYARTGDSIASVYMVQLGNDIFAIETLSGIPTNLYNLASTGCNASVGPVVFHTPGAVPSPIDTITVKLYPTGSVNLFSELASCPFYMDTTLSVDSASTDIMVENNLNVNGSPRNALATLTFANLYNLIPAGATIVSARLVLKADINGHIHGLYDSANSMNPQDSLAFSLTGPMGYFPELYLDTLLYQGYNSPWYASVKDSIPFQNDSIDVASYLNNYYQQNYLSNTFLLSQGSSGMLSAPIGQDTVPSVAANGGVPQYLLSGYGGYYSTFYNQRYSDTTKWPALYITYQAPRTFMDTSGAVLKYITTNVCNTIVSRSCFSSITDTIVNPYQYGLLGNFRPLDNYVYYNSRSQSDPTQATNIRKDGTIQSFVPYWSLQGSLWTPSLDSSRWVWNTQSTLYNRKGFEIENKNALGIYTAGLYGYELNLPTAVVQNARFQESAFEGFEDYGFNVNSCNTSCTIARPFDWSNVLTTPPTNGPILTTVTAHTGLYSLLIPSGQTASIAVPVITNPASPLFSFTDSTGTDSCGIPRFDGFKASANSVLPNFEPYAGKRMYFSAWVKENDSCNCSPYTGNHVVISFTTGGAGTYITLSPRGNVIEGWQRYDTLFDIPANTTGLTISLEASPSVTTYFDDIRLMPFNGDMKSYVYNPINLRLMAELDENNYATFYEYDNDGTLIRIKKETERGVLTIKETRSALVKPN